MLRDLCMTSLLHVGPNVMLQCPGKVVGCSALTGSCSIECVAQRGIMINDQIAAVHGKLLRPKLLALEPQLVGSSQAVGSRRRGSGLTAHCSWALFGAAASNKCSAAALFTDIKGSYYGVMVSLSIVLPCVLACSVMCV